MWKKYVVGKAENIYFAADGTKYIINAETSVKNGKPFVSFSTTAGDVLYQKHESDIIEYDPHTSVYQYNTIYVKMNLKN